MSLWPAHDENDQNRPTKDAPDVSTALLPRAYGCGSVRFNAYMVSVRPMREVVPLELIVHVDQSILDARFGAEDTAASTRLKL